MAMGLGVLLAMRLAFVGPLAQPAAPLQCTFVGNAAVRVSDGRLTLLTAFPYQSGAFGYMAYDRSAEQPRGDVVLLITHGHADHFDPDPPRDPTWRVFGPRGFARDVRGATAIDPGRALDVGNGARVHAFATAHGNIAHQSYRVDWRGRSLYFTGDTDDSTMLLEQRALDVAFVTPWLWKAVTTAGRHIDATRIVIYHHRAGEIVPDCRDTCIVPRQGEGWTLE